MGARRRADVVPRETRPAPRAPQPPHDNQSERAPAGSVSGRAGFMMKYDGESEERGAWLASDGLLLDATEGISMHLAAGAAATAARP